MGQDDQIAQSRTFNVQYYVINHILDKEPVTRTVLPVVDLTRTTTLFKALYSLESRGTTRV